uniref:CPD photolyase n=1 Tax=Astyanax mexicanus TaxID=7994 RepID=A0A8B9J603_ASTMX
MPRPLACAGQSEFSFGVTKQEYCTMSAKKAELKRRGGSGQAEGAGGKKQRSGESAAAAGGREDGWLGLEVAELRAKNTGCKFNDKRVRFLSEEQKVKQSCSGVLYWMSRDQRVQDNWALIYAQQLALAEELPLHICFCLVPRYLDAAYRQYAFMIRGLQEVAKECKSLDIQFHFLRGDPEQLLLDFVKSWNIGALVTDFNPLRLHLQWIENVRKGLPSNIPFLQVDAHNVVPCWEASPKLEYGARTIRGKITKQLPDFLTEFPPVDTHPHASKKTSVNWEEVLDSVEVDRTVGEVEWARPGTSGGMAMLESFIQQRLRLFATERNNPNSEAVSHLSPWLRAGQLSAQRVVKEVQRWGKNARESVASFTEELVVRRELADNFCYYNKEYDSIAEHLFTENEKCSFKSSEINIWWNIPGCMWSICGIHDQGWAERPVFGKVRYMNYAGCKRKFDVSRFERKYACKQNCSKHLNTYLS